MSFIEHEYSNGLTVKVHTDNESVAEVAFYFYDREKHRLIFECPFCENDDEWDNLTGEHEGDNFEDTYTCDRCNTLVTIITPYGTEYHAVLMSTATYMIEFMYGKEPSTWPDEPGIPLEWLDNKTSRINVNRHSWIKFELINSGDDDQPEWTARYEQKWYSKNGPDLATLQGKEITPKEWYADIEECRREVEAWYAKNEQKIRFELREQ